VGTAAHAAGHDVSVFVEAWNGVSAPKLASYPVVGASVTGSSFSRVEELFRTLRRQRPDVVLIAGGPHATLIPTDVLKIADYAVRDEGEETFVELLAALERGGDPSDIQGLSFRRGGQVVHTPRRPFVSGRPLVEDLALLEGWKRRSLLGQLRRGGVYTGYATTSRGCPFPCTFCYENMIGGTSFRRVEIDAFIDDVRKKRDFLGTRTFWLADSNFTTNPGHCAEVLDAIVEAKLDCRFSALCRTDVGHRPEVLDRMRRAGFDSLVLGVEAVDDGTLKKIRKKQTVDDASEAIANIQAHGMDVYGLFMVGFDHDTARTPWSIVQYAEAHKLAGVSIYCMTEYASLPGRTLPRYRICETDLDYYNGHFVTTFPLRVRPSVLEREVFAALLAYQRPGKILAALARADSERAQLHLAHFVQLRKMAAVSARHQKKLQEVEAPYYDAGGALRVDALKARPLIDLRLSPEILADWDDPDEMVAPRKVVPAHRLARARARISA
jgi:radical SAM superfamily enzyme YgiQ (UPF0313 family)